MIVRELLHNQKLLDLFDFFNDTKDTVDWLRGLNTHHATYVALVLEDRFASFMNLQRLKSYVRRCGQGTRQGANLDCKLPLTVTRGIVPYCCYHDPENLKKFEPPKRAAKE